MNEGKHDININDEKLHINTLIYPPVEMPFDAIPFNLINEEDIEEAVLCGIKQEDKEIQEIVENDASPTFQNTLLPLEYSGKLLNKAVNVMGIYLANATTDTLENLAQKLYPLISEHNNNISFNYALFKRIETVKHNNENLSCEEQRLLDITYDEFIRRGVNLPEEKQKRLREISSELSKTVLQYSKNILDDTNSYLLTIKNRNKLEGLNAHHLEAAAQTAKEKGTNGWAFTMNAPSFQPLLMLCKNRTLRKNVWYAYNRLGMKDGKFDNRPLVEKIVNLRMEKAQILGFDCFADYVLTKRMAGSKERVNQFLDLLIEKYKPQAIKESKELKAFIQKKTSKNFNPKPWDASYYAHILKVSKHKVDTEKLRVYFEIDRVIEGVFGLAKKLYGIRFKLNKDIPTIHKDVKVYEVYDEDNSFLALLYADFYPRKEKKSGAWTYSIKEQYTTEEGKNIRPHVGITMNFSKPTKKKPALLTLGEVTTFLHEFGHALHEIFSNTRFLSQSGTNVYWDFVELPSQFMENYALEKDFLKTFAVHYKTGKPLPEKVIERIIQSRNFRVASACMRQLSFGLLDMGYYTLAQKLEGDIISFEKKAWAKAVLGRQSRKICMSTNFQHIMSGGYAAGYYSYKWAEVLDADAYSLFQQTGIFNKETAKRFRDNILSKGATQDPNILYNNFRGQAPTINALLRRDGIN